MSEILFPFVYWAQDARNVFLRVDLRNIEFPDINIYDKQVTFQAIGVGAKGRNKYNFALEFFAPVDPEESVYKLTSRGVDFTIKKRNANGDQWWPSLTFTNQRLSWLKIDFDKWQDPDAESSEDESRKFENFDINKYEEEQAKEMYERMMQDYKSEASSKYSFDAMGRRKLYLVTYNATMFLGYLIIFCQLVRGYVAEGPEYFQKAWAETSSKMICCQIAQTFEILHALVGYVKSSWKASLLQICGRSIVLFLILLPEPRLHEKPFVFYLFEIWSLIEIIRYPYYLLSTLKTELSIITWLRYTLWIPLYPLGFLCEGVIILRALVFYDETEKFSLSLPNAWNFSFDFGLCLRVYLIAVFIPGLVFLMQHMRAQRLSKLGGNARKGKQKKLK